MDKLPQISQAEFEVMNVIWSCAPVSTNEVAKRLTREKQWSPKTIHTLLTRLEKKGVVTHEKDGRVFVYRPLVEKEAYRRAEGKSYLSRFFDGAVNRMMVSFLDGGEFSKQELDELAEILEKKRGK